MELAIMEFLVNLAQTQPWAMAIVVWVGVFRLTFKPMMTAVEAYISATPHKSDDEFLAKVKAHPIYKGVSWFVDYSMSIKLPK